MTTPHGALSYRRFEGTDPLGDGTRACAAIHAAGARFEKIMNEDGEAEVQAFYEEMRHLEAYEEVRDDHYRRIGGSEHGRYATIRLGFRCNQDCGFCWQGRDWPDAEEADYLRWVDEAARAGVRFLVFSGGEPTLHRRLPELVARAAKHHGIPVSVQTNAIRLRDPAYTLSLKEAGLHDVFISLHSADPEISDRLTRAAGTHAKTCEGISQALEAGIEVGLNCVVEARNYEGLEAYADAIVARWPGVSRVAFSHPCHAYDPDAWTESAVSVETVRPQLVAACERLATAGIKVDVVGSGCSFPPCVFRESPGFIRGVDMGDMDGTDTASRRFVDACQECAFRSRCLGVRREYVEVMGEDGIVPFDLIPEGLGAHARDAGEDMDGSGRR